MTDDYEVRAFAEKINPRVDDLFTQYLCGNRTFEDCAIAALESLSQEDPNDYERDCTVNARAKLLPVTEEVLPLIDKLRELLEELGDDPALDLLTQITDLMDLENPTTNK